MVLYSNFFDQFFSAGVSLGSMRLAKTKKPVCATMRSVGRSFVGSGWKKRNKISRTLMKANLLFDKKYPSGIRS